MLEVFVEPGGGKLGDPLECAGFFEQMGGAGNHHDAVGSRQLATGQTVRLEDSGVPATDNDQRRRRYLFQRVTRQIGTATAGHYGPHRLVAGGGDQRGRRAGAGAEQSDRKALDRRVLAHPIKRGQHTVGKQGDVETEFAGTQVRLLLALGQKIQQQGGETVVPEHLRDKEVAWTEAGTSRSVREHHKSPGIRRDLKIAE